MAVAKKQRKGKACKNGTEENLWTEGRRSEETNTLLSWLAQFAQGRLSGKETKCIKRESQDGLRPLFWGWPTLTPEECTSLCLLNKAPICNTGLLFQTLLLWDRTEQTAHSPDDTQNPVLHLVIMSPNVLQSGIILLFPYIFRLQYF